MTDNTNTREARIDAYVEANKKSPILALGLAILLGPIGYLYTSVLSGAIAILLTIATVGIPHLTIVIWLACVVAAPFETASVNKKLRIKAELMTG